VILRGGRQPNYEAENVAAAARTLAQAGIPARLMIDFSHGNSGKDPQRQIIVAHNIAAQLADGDKTIFGVMMESHLKAGRQDLLPGKPLIYGVSITDACAGWEESRAVLDALAEAVRQRRLKAALDNEDE
jgi:3-deoxy-7-phosphoheptulonate synthase